MNNLTLANSGRQDSGRVIFIGCAFIFPDMLLGLVSSELGGIAAMRLDSPETICPADEAGSLLRLVVIEDRFAGEIVEDFEGIRKRFGGAEIVLAYRDVETARGLFSLQQREGKLEGLRFIPINAPIGGWMSMMLILLSGDFMVPGELLSHGAAGLPPCDASSPDGESAPAPHAEPVLTQREQEVLAQVAEGHRNKLIADKLGVSEHTVKLHIHHIISKIGVQNRTAAAGWYLAQGPEGWATRSAG